MSKQVVALLVSVERRQKVIKEDMKKSLRNIEANAKLLGISAKAIYEFRNGAEVLRNELK